jgi:hypothetical protein
MLSYDRLTSPQSKTIVTFLFKSFTDLLINQQQFDEIYQTIESEYQTIESKSNMIKYLLLSRRKDRRRRKKEREKEREQSSSRGAGRKAVQADNKNRFLL